MVVARKTPLVPPPPTSRTNSSQATPRTAKSKVQALPVQSVPIAYGSGDGPNGSGNSNSGKGNSSDVNLSSRKHKSKSKSTKDSKKSSKPGLTFVDFLMYFSLAFFTIYTIRVCPTDVTHNSPVCRGLSRYRELVLEPYVFPAFHRALAHPSIAPHVERVKPHVNTVIRIGKPIVRRTRVEWNSRIVPQWNKRVVPQWNKRVVPQWNRHIAPIILRVDQKVEPYRSRVTREYNRYSNYITLHLWTTKTNLQRWQRQAQPYVVLAATKTYHGYQTAKPYAIPIWNHIKAGARKLLLLVREQRILFVDPHVARIWEKVKELSSGKPKGSGTVEEEPTAPKAAAPVTKVETNTSEDEGIPLSMPSSSVIPKEAETTASVATESSTVATALPTTEATEHSTVAIESPPTASATESKVTSVSSVVSEVVESTLPTTASSTTTSSPSEEVTPSLDITGPSLVTHEPISTLLKAPDEADIDLEEFARDLGLDDPDIVEAEETVVPPPVETESEEEKAEKQRQKEIRTAEQRADITKRHTKWEADLQELVKSMKKSLRKALVAIRKPAAIELKENKQIRAAINGVAAEAEKNLKGAEIYLKTLKTESKEDAVKATIWDKLIGKVDAKFRDRLKEVDNLVNGWYMNVLNQEAQEVQRVTSEVKDLAGDAQTNIGMDYSWLADVTYNDWQRYHDLMRVSENFTELAISIQKGTHPSPPINPVVDVLEELESEIEDIVDSFETRLQRLKRDGEHTLNGQAAETASTSEPEFSILPVPKDEVDREGVTGDIPPVIIGRSKEEIVDAFSRAGEEGAGTIASQSVKVEPEKIVESLGQDVYAEADQATQIPAADHVEL